MEIDNKAIQKKKDEYEALKEIVQRQDVQERFLELLGDNARPFLASVLTTVGNDPELRTADPASIVSAAAQAAMLKLPVSPQLGQAWLVPRYIRRGDSTIKRVFFQVGWKGYVQLALRSQMYAKLNVIEIYQGEWIEEDRLTNTVKLKGEKINDEVTGYVAYFRLVNGLEKFHYMTVEQVREWAQRYSPSYGKQGSAWQTHFDDMAKKTVLSYLLRKYGLLSIELQEAWGVEEANRALKEEDERELPDFPVDEEKALDVEARPAAESYVMSLEEAEAITSRAGLRYGEANEEQLRGMLKVLQKALAKNPADPDLLRRQQAITLILKAREWGEDERE